MVSQQVAERERGRRKWVDMHLDLFCLPFQQEEDERSGGVNFLFLEKMKPKKIDKIRVSKKYLVAFEL